MPQKEKKTPKKPQTYYAVVLEGEPDFENLHETLEDALEEATEFMQDTDSEEVVVYQLVPVRRVRMNISEEKL